MRIHYLSDTWPWFGSHQCYSRVVDFVRPLAESVDEVKVRYDFLNRVIGKFHLMTSGQSARKDSVFAAAEFKYLIRHLKAYSPQEVYHVLFFDTHFGMFGRWEKAPRNLIATLHHPAGRTYPAGMERALERLSSAIVMYRGGAEYFSRYIGRGRVKFVHYGVDVGYFSPGTGPGEGPIRLFFTGQNGRNLPMLKRILPVIFDKFPDVVVDILVPSKVFGSLGAGSRIRDEKVKWYPSLGEAVVRDLYRQSYLLLMPMEDSGVNTAIVEAMASGLPVVTTDVGGVRDYGGGTVYPVVKNNDDDAMIALVERYISDRSWRDSVSEASRNFAVEDLAWEKVAQRHLEVYRELAG